mmetsp:Transcript_14132/g.57460  ORF Transcript_14132/g.57460 Transcript_14132/m.57460 type:complete len:205 (-) Transcript_14132:2157-2771(-)
MCFSLYFSAGSVDAAMALSSSSGNARPGSSYAGRVNTVNGRTPWIIALSDPIQPRPWRFRMYRTVSGGSTTALIANTQKMTSAENTPNDLSGISGDRAVAQKAAEVVKDVTKMAWSARRIVCLILCGSVAGLFLALNSSMLWWKASMNTNTSSAPMPITTKMMRKLMNWKNETWNTTRNKKNATKMEVTVIIIDVAEMMMDPVW